MKYDAIINPVKGKRCPALGPFAVMVSSETDLQALLNNTAKLRGIATEHCKNLMMSRVYFEKDFSITGPVVSAAYAVMILESLIAWGARKIIFFGWCGAISPDVAIGDIILPTGAFIDEGTSRHYCADENEPATPSALIVKETKEILTQKGLAFREGTVWSLDAIYRETPEKVQYYQKRNALAVEMELSALFTLGKFRNADIGGILVVSDELSTFVWKPGFNDERFKQSRMAAADIITEIIGNAVPDLPGFRNPQVL